MTQATTLAQLIQIDTDDCVLWPHYVTTSGYGQVWCDGRMRSVHVIACESRHGTRPERMHAAHRCGVRTCVNPRHIRWATNAENQADKNIHGTVMHGEGHFAAKLTVAAVRDIRSSTLSVSDLARRYGVSRHTIRTARDGDTWARVA